MVIKYRKIYHKFNIEYISNAYRLVKVQSMFEQDFKIQFLTNAKKHFIITGFFKKKQKKQNALTEA